MTVSGTSLNWWFTFLPLQTCWLECDTIFFLSFCVFTIMSHVPTSMYKLLNNLATIRRYKFYMCSMRCLVRDWLDDTSSTCVRFDVLHATISTIQNLHVYKTLFGTRLTRRYKIHMCTRRCLVRDYSTIQVLHVFDALFGTRLSRRSRASDTKQLIQKQKTKKNKDTPAPLFPGVASATSPQFDTDPSHPKKQQHSRLPYISTITQSVRHMSQAQSVPGHVTQTSCPCWFMDSHQATFLPLDIMVQWSVHLKKQSHSRLPCVSAKP